MQSNILELGNKVRESPLILIGDTFHLLVESYYSCLCCLLYLLRIEMLDFNEVLTLQFQRVDPVFVRHNINFNQLMFLHQTLCTCQVLAEIIG